jgi:hypothetical protein
MIGLPRKLVFIDRNSGGRAFKSLIVDAGIRVVLHDEHFRDPTTPDEVWVKEVGRLGWLMVTGDVATERSFLFLTALKRSRAHVFILCGLNHASPQQRAECIIDAYSEMLSLSHQYRGPRLWKASAGKRLVEVNFRATLGKMRRYGRTLG